MSVRKRTWFTRAERKRIDPEAKKLASAAGEPDDWGKFQYLERAALAFGIEPREVWIADYTDQQGDRHIETFPLKKAAVEHHATVVVDVGKGTHTPQSKSKTVAEAADDWIKYVELEGRERTTVIAYRQQVDLHIKPRLGREKLAKLTTPRINTFRDDLLALNLKTGKPNLSRAMAKKVLVSLKSLLKDAKRRGNVAQNVALDVQIKMDKRGSKLKGGVDIPTPDEIKGCGPEKSRAARSPARRSLRCNGQAQIGIGGAHNTDWPARPEHVAGVEARLSEGRARPRVSEWQRPRRGPRQPR